MVHKIFKKSFRMIDKFIDKCYDFINKRIIMWSAPKEPV